MPLGAQGAVGLGLLHTSTGSDTRVTPPPSLANTPWDIPVMGHTCALLQPPHGHLQVLGLAQLLPEQVIPATDLLWGGKQLWVQGQMLSPISPSQGGRGPSSSTQRCPDTLRAHSPSLSNS